MSRKVTNEQHLFGNRPKVGESVFLSIIQPNGWQIEKMLEMAVGLYLEDYETHHGEVYKIGAAEVNDNDLDEFMEMANAENIKVLTADDVREMKKN
jgi:hypothetical protein